MDSLRNSILSSSMAQDWAKPFRDRVMRSSDRSMSLEAQLASIEAITRKLRHRGWLRRHSSARKRDGHVDSRYYVAPGKPRYEVRISTHPHPDATYRWRQYIISQAVVVEYNAFGFVAKIEREWRQWRREHTA